MSRMPRVYEPRAYYGAYCSYAYDPGAPREAPRLLLVDPAAGVVVADLAK